MKCLAIQRETVNVMDDIRYYNKCSEWRHFVQTQVRRVMSGYNFWKRT